MNGSGEIGSVSIGVSVIAPKTTKRICVDAKNCFTSFYDRNNLAASRAVCHINVVSLCAERAGLYAVTSQRKEKIEDYNAWNVLNRFVTRSGLDVNEKYIKM